MGKCLLVRATPATTLANSCYSRMFKDCSALQVYSSSGTGHTKAWRLPTSGTLTRAGTGTSQDTLEMFIGTVGTYTSTDPSTTATVLTFYTQNEPI